LTARRSEAACWLLAFCLEQKKIFQSRIIINSDETKPDGIFSSRWGRAFLQIMDMAKTPKSGTAPGPDASAPDGPAALARLPGAARRAPRHQGRRRGGQTVRSMVTVATRRPRRQPAMKPTQAHLLTLSRLHQAATRNPDDKLQEPSTAPPTLCDPASPVRVLLLRAPVQFVLSERVASSSGGQQAEREQVRLSRPHGQLTWRPPRRHRHHQPHCQPHHVAALGGAARGKPPTMISWATTTTTLTTAAKPLSLVVA